MWGGWVNFMDMPGGGATLALIGAIGTGVFTNKINKRTIQEARNDKATADRQTNHAILETIGLKANEIARAVEAHNIADVMWHHEAMNYEFDANKQKEIEQTINNSYYEALKIKNDGMEFIADKELVLRGRDAAAADLVKNLSQKIDEKLAAFGPSEFSSGEHHELRTIIEKYTDAIRSYRTSA